MLKQLILENWKSFRYAELPLDPLTVLIGTNASGKSNVVEALEFLQRFARGEKIETALVGDKTFPSIRGGVEWAALKSETQFTLKVIVAGEDKKTDYLYAIKIQTLPEVKVSEEYIETQRINGDFPNTDIEKTQLFSPSTLLNIADNRTHIKITESIIDISEIPTNLREEISSKLNNNITLNELVTVLNKNYLPLKQQIKDRISFSINGIFIINPIPSKMREYSSLSDTLENDGSNIAGVLAALDSKQKAEVESTLSAYIKNFPEGDIKRVFAEPVERLKTDAMLYCEEEWKPGEMTLINAKTMSDGTLRFLAILTALLTRPEGSQLVIEEIDNGLHPSRAELLVRILREIGTKRKIDILLTTHNPALLDALGPEIVPFVVVAHRDKDTGKSKLTLLEDIDNFSKLFASYSLGDMATKGAIERSLSRSE
jgi:predicted ATPase